MKDNRPHAPPSALACALASVTVHLAVLTLLTLSPRRPPATHYVELGFPNAIDLIVQSASEGSSTSPEVAGARAEAPKAPAPRAKPRSPASQAQRSAQPPTSPAGELGEITHGSAWTDAPEAAPSATAAVAAPAPTASAKPGALGGAELSGRAAHEAIARYFSSLRSAVEAHKEYPQPARRRGREGTVIVHLLIARDGRLIEVGVARSSGERLLDDAAIKAARAAGAFPPAPPTLRADPISVEIPLVYRIAGGE
jgi:periplasmic protein TonB